MTNILKKRGGTFLPLLILTCRTFLPAQVPAGDHITDTVRCREDKDQSYALYCPAQYENKKNLPVILIFDPSARGRTGIDNFIEAGRKYGFILACSNNSRNGPVSDNFRAASAMFRDVTSRFNTDQRRIFAAGFSGGSRFALAYAVIEKRISGVIGCGAGLPNDRNYFPPSASGLLYYGLAGNRDMNYLEMRELPFYFSARTNVTAYLRIFSGGHEWPGPALITDAVEWMLLQEMNRKIVPASQSFLSYMENKTQNLITSSLSAGNIADGIMYLKFAERDFRGTTFGSGLAEQLAAAEKSPDYQAAIRIWNNIASTEQEKKEKYMNNLGELVNSGSTTGSPPVWWKNEIGSLTRLRDNGSPDNSQMASRLLNFISILCSVQGASYFRERHFAEASVMFKICTWSDSGNQNNYYDLARSLAGSGKSGESLQALSDAVSHGFDSRKTAEQEPAFGEMRNDPRFKSLLLKMK